MGDEPGPRPLSWSLDRVAKGIRRVDVAGFAKVEAVWPTIEAASPSGAMPVRLERGTLVVAVASGAHAARATRDAHDILDALGTALADPPTSLRVVVRG